MKCFDCPRRCGVDRSKAKGFCNEGEKIRVAKVIENFAWEEPCISGEKGALAIFFSGCNLRCSFCQNYEISHVGKGEEFSPDEFREFLLSFDLEKFSSIDFITPTHFSSALIAALDGCRLPLPVVWNSSGYEAPAMIERLDKIVDVFLPDFKYYSDQNGQTFSKAGDYFAVASEAVKKMRQLRPVDKFENGLLVRGLLIRHLLLPGQVRDCMAVLDFIAQNLKGSMVSLMSQFTPQKFGPHRKVLPLEYKALLAHAEKLGLDSGYFQDISAADENFVPEF